MNGITTRQRIGELVDLHARLTKDHFGVGTEIQRLLDAFAPWYLFPGTQTRPRVIGLWGMTGTGKSSLVRNLVKELGLEEITFWLDAGECHSNYWLGNLIHRVEEHLTGAPFIVVVDEFQHARTKGIGKPEPGDLRRFWEFLDAGRMVTWPDHFQVEALRDLTDRLAAAIEAGVRIQNGRVVSGSKQFTELVARHYSDKTENGPGWAVPSSVLDMLRSAFLEPKPTIPALERKLSEMDGQGLLAFLHGLRLNTQRPNVVDASQALVFVLGNLDELYVSGQEPIAEMDPDVLLHRHQDIGTVGVHHALLTMFRIEQVGRLGNDHVIFPPMGKNTIDRLIGHEVDALLKRLSFSCGKELLLDPELVARIKEAPAPAILGARPVIEAVHRIIPLLFSQAFQKCKDCKRITLSVKNDRPVALLRYAGRKEEFPLQWPMGLFREFSRSPELQARHAVHEAGHVICGIMLCGMKPLQVCARTTDLHVSGFVIWEELKDTPITRERIVPELARLLGGMAAEEVRYGEAQVSTGGRSDIATATEFALELAKTHGLGRDKLFHAHHTNTEGGGFRTGLVSAEEQVKEWMEEAEQLAQATIREHSKELTRLVDALQLKHSLGTSDVEEVIQVVRPSPVRV